MTRALFFTAPLLWLCLAGPVHGQPSARSAGLSAEYTVALGDPASHSFHVAATFRNVREPTLDVALPVWTPGMYTVKSYANNISKFTAHDSLGVRLRAPKVEASTWRIEAGSRHTVIVEFDYAANDLSWTGAGIADRYALSRARSSFSSLEVIETVQPRCGSRYRVVGRSRPP